jgi:hypothetical protein
MKLHYIATLFVTGAAAVAIAAAPSASAASAITKPDTGGSVHTYQRPGNVELRVEPPQVSDTRSYGQFSSPAPFLGD